VCHGYRGERRQRDRQGQEEQLGALGLIVNAIVLYNTTTPSAPSTTSLAPARRSTPSTSSGAVRWAATT
jgi:hypothetical protein